MRRVWREPALPILLLAGLVQIDRGYAADIGLFFGTALLVVLDAPRWPAGAVSAERTVAGRREQWVLAGTAALYGLAFGPLPRDSDWLQLAMAVPGALVLWILVRPVRSTRDRVAEGVETSPPRWWVWPALGVALALVELGSFLSQTGPRTDSFAHPTVSTTVEPWLDLVPLRMLALGFWLAIGWWLVRRVLAWQGRS